MLCLLGFANKESGIMVSSIGTVLFIKFGKKSVEMGCTLTAL